MSGDRALRRHRLGLHLLVAAVALGATAEADRLHFADMAVQVGRLQKIGMP